MTPPRATASQRLSSSGQLRDNLDSFNAGIQNGLTPQEAAMNTFTGMMAARYGFTNVIIEGTVVLYARGANGARLSFRNVDGGIQIVGNADKGNESAVISRLLDLYGR